MHEVADVRDVDKGIGTEPLNTEALWDRRIESKASFPLTPITIGRAFCLLWIPAKTNELLAAINPTRYDYVFS